ncbi:MAG: 8-oxo-dGTP diphosphatase [Clostridiales bacterium]|nr:8-oxo-dGTP diphosphatase [Clostridiales bacterium]
MKNTTLCYIENERGDYLMLHRVKKENDCNRDKWIGVGGKFEDGESPEECVLRETLEETGLTLTDWRYRGIVTFVSDRWETEYMHLFTATGWTGRLHECDEGVLEWVSREQFRGLPQWEGDRIFLRLIEEDAPFFSLKLRYEGEHLAYAALNGKELAR